MGRKVLNLEKFIPKRRGRITKGDPMAAKFTSFFSFWFVFGFCAFMAVHYAHMKTPAHYRGIASWEQPKVTPWYDASFKY